MSIIKVNCVDQTLVFENTPVIASGGLEENFVQFSFCSQWDGFTKTAVFWRSESEVFHNLLDEENSCQVAPEVTASDGVIYFGVFGVDAAGRQRTSEVLTYRVVKGAITEGTVPSDPTPDIYTQLIGKYQEMLEVSKDTLAKEQAFERAMTAAQQAFEQALTQAVDKDQEVFETAMTAAHNAFKQEILKMIEDGLLPDDSITTEKLKDDVVTTEKLADGAVTAEKVAPGLLVDAYNKTETLTDETKAKYGLGTDAVPNDVFNALAFKNILNLCIDKIQTSRNWTAPKATGQLFKVFAVGGGGGGSYQGGGGGGGYVVVDTLEIAEGTQVPVVCGAGGAADNTKTEGGKGGTGGTTTFGSLLSAAGGEGGVYLGNGGAGGAGGGAEFINSSSSVSNGGDGGTYGGGGGAANKGKGGDGGTYGGGGGGGTGGTGGAGGTYGGNGGVAGKTSNTASEDAPSIRPSVSFVDVLLSVDGVHGSGNGGDIGGGGGFFGDGGAGARTANQSAGGGGGGYCGNGGSGGQYSGGGGGGYCGNGGDANYGAGGGGGFFCNGGSGVGTSSNYRGAGGGGGFFSDGEDGNSSAGAGGNGGVLIMYFKED